MDKTNHSSCLVLIQTFETLWAYYSQSNGQLYDSECRQAANDFIKVLRQITSSDKGLEDQVIRITVNRMDCPEILDQMETWATGTETVPFKTFSASRSLLFGFLSVLKFYLHAALKIPINPLIVMSPTEIEHSERSLRWKGYLPDEFIRSSICDPDELVTRAGKTRSVVVIGDIRRSQQLMNFAKGTDGFLTLMSSFINQSRDLIQKHKGFFDKFTGDGFIAYFNEEICGQLEKDFIECSIKFIKDEAEAIGKLFEEWGVVSDYSPDKPLGLAIGCDIGQVDFHNVNNHLVAIGDSVVWAYRMANAGEAGEVIAHQPLAKLYERYPELRFTPIVGETKNSISYSAQGIKFGE